MDRESVQMRVTWGILFALLTLNVEPGISDELDSEIYLISEEESSRAISATKAECLRNRSIDALLDNQDVCLTEFHSAICWPTTPGNQTVTVPCPYYVTGLRKHGHVSRQCLWTPGSKMAGNVSHWQFGAVDFSDCFVSIGSSSKLVAILMHIGTPGYIISTLSLIFAITIMVRFRRLHCTRNTVHINLFIAILLRCLFHFLQKAFDTNIEWFCRLLTTMTTLTVMATHSWVFVEALYLHNTVVVQVFRSNVASIFGYSIIGWVTPIILTAIWVILRLTVTTGTTCWILDNVPHSPSRLLISLSPVVMLLFNLAFSINVFRVVLVKMKSQTSNETSRVKTLLKSICILIFIFGIYHVVFLPLDLLESQDVHYESQQLEMIKLYCRHVMEGLQGFCVALVLCFMNKEVTAELKRHYRQSRIRTTLMDNPRTSHSSEVRVRKADEQPRAPSPAIITKAQRSSISRALRLVRHSSPFKRPAGPRKPSALCSRSITNNDVLEIVTLTP